MTGEKPQCEKNGAGIQGTLNNAGSGLEGAWEEPPGLSEAYFTSDESGSDVDLLKVTGGSGEVSRAGEASGEG